MTEPAILCYFSDPFGLGRALFCLQEPGTEPRCLPAAAVSAFTGPIVTYDFPKLVDELRRGSVPPPKHGLDILEAVKLGAGLAKDDGGEDKWNIWPHLISRFEDVQTGRAFVAAVTLEKQPPRGEEGAMLEAGCAALSRLWFDLRTELVKGGEFDRLERVEWPLQSVLAVRQYLGIRVDSHRADQILERLATEKYSAYGRVAELVGAGPTDLNFWNVGEYLHLTDLADLSQIVDSGKLEGAFELAKYRSGFARDFLTLTRAKRDEAIVRRALDSNDRLFPVFHVVGTVTGRILVSDPYLQQLRRSYRDLVLPDIGHRHIYLDYAQFEPGVLAGMTQESDFIAAYNSGDVYEHLAVALFEDTNQRERAKRAFLAFLYGMTPERIARVVVGDGGQGEGVVRNAIERFFATFPGIAAFRAAQHSLLLENGYVSSMFGNRRNRRRTGALSGKESRWAVNHPVQATASLILKEALLALATRFSPSALVLPVHDAILLELPDDDEFGARVAEATAIMIGAFRARLPEIDVRVTAKEFANG